MSEDAKILRELKEQLIKQTAPKDRRQASKQVAAATAQARAQQQAQTGGLSPVEGRILGPLKHKPSDDQIRRRHVGLEALSLIARRALVGLRKLRTSDEMVIYDTAPLPNAEYMVTPLSLIGNPDGTADLLITEVSSEILVAGDYTIHDVSTEMGPADPKLSITNFAKYMFIQNQGVGVMYVCIDGEYDPVAKTTTKNTTPASGTGIMLPGSGVLDISHLMKANPRLISPSGDQTISIVMTR